ncbi:MAG: sigma-70 family RNA polymerase sigma factor [Planctomycetaceae bacterium]
MSARYDTTSLTLLARVQADQPDAWERMLELYAPLVRYWCRRCNLSAEDTADVFQETFRSVASHVGAFDRDERQGSFRGWLRTITSNRIRDHFRRQAGKAVASGGTDAQQHLQSLPDPLAEEDEAAEADLMSDALQRALNWIQGDYEERTWTAFYRSQIEEHATEDIAADLGLTPAAVRKAKYRVLRRLREELQGLIQWPDTD